MKWVGIVFMVIYLAKAVYNHNFADNQIEAVYYLGWTILWSLVIIQHHLLFKDKD
jgi:hypothetical protein